MACVGKGSSCHDHGVLIGTPSGVSGTGRVLLCGDGCLKEWTVVNQCRTDDGGPGDQTNPQNPV